MKRISILLFALVLCLSAASASGQTRRRTTSKRTRPAAATAKPEAAPAALQQAAARVAEQIKNIGRFLYLYGPIWKELQTNEAAAQNNPSSAQALQANRAKLKELFHNYRVQMDALETIFSSSSDLRPYYTRLLGVASSASIAEEHVGAGRYDAAGRALLEVMNRLTDVLVDMQAR